MMPTLTIGFFLCNSECKGKILKKSKKKFKDISFVASKNDWNLIFTVGKEKEITSEEIKRFEKKLNKFYNQIKPFIEKYNLHKNPDIVPILNRIKYLKEEYLNYPFPNREEFFNLRMDFYLQQIKKATLKRRFK